MAAGRIDQDVLIRMTRDIVIAEVSHNQVAPEAVPTLIDNVYESLCRIAVHPGAFLGTTGESDAAFNVSAPELAEVEPGGRQWPQREPAAWVEGAGSPEAVTTAAVRPSRGRAEPGEPTPSTVAAPGAAVDDIEPGDMTARAEGRSPAVPRERSIHPDFIVCLFDGVRRKMLKRHIKTRYGMSPEAYRTYWELPEDYPMTAPNYSTEKREYAMLTGFGLPRSARARVA